jgi:hypothetical protein
MSARIFYWIPRILTIIAILFVMMFSIDVFEGNEPLSKQLIGFLIHNIPAWILIGVLVVAWKWEIAGGSLFILCSLAGSLVFGGFRGNPGSLIVMAPFLLIGILFIVHEVVFVRKLADNQ